MDLYPNLPFTLGSGRVRSDGGSVTITEDGMPRKRRRFPTIWHDIEIVHTNLSVQEIDALEAFYDAHENDWVRVDWPARGISYEMLLTGWDEPKQDRSGMLFNVIVRGRGRRI